METMRYLRVIETATGEVVKQLDVTMRTPQFIQHAQHSLMKAMDKEHYHLVDVTEEATSP